AWVVGELGEDQVGQRGLWLHREIDLEQPDGGGRGAVDRMATLVPQRPLPCESHAGLRGGGKGGSTADGHGQFDTAGGRGRWRGGSERLRITGLEGGRERGRRLARRAGEVRRGGRVRITGQRRGHGAAACHARARRGNGRAATWPSPPVGTARPAWRPR